MNDVLEAVPLSRLQSFWIRRAVHTVYIVACG
jgi:hypothetical protein